LDLSLNNPVLSFTDLDDGLFLDLCVLNEIEADAAFVTTAFLCDAHLIQDVQAELTFDASFLGQL